MKKLIACLAAFFWGLSIWGQGKYTISGYVRDDKSGEELIGAAIGVNEMPSIGISTNAYGYYSLTVPKGKCTIMVNFIGYEMLSFPVDLTGNLK
jgi:hypothetical protein